jgi:hypothetical protein
MRSAEVATVEDLRAYLKDEGREWFTIGWRGDPDVYMTDGTVLFEQLSDGRVEVTGWDRGNQTSSTVQPNLRAAVQVFVNDHLADELRLELSDRGLTESVEVVKATSADGPIPSEGRWVVVVSEGAFHVGGMTMGRFRHYESFEDARLAVDVLQRLVQGRGPVELAPDPQELARRGQVTGQGIVERTRQRGTAGEPGVGPGDVLDRVGHESGSQLFALGTPFAMRSQPPDMVGVEYHRYRVVDGLPDAREGTAVAWFGQPGGGAMIVAEHPVRWYLDHGHLVELVDG